MVHLTEELNVRIISNKNEKKTLPPPCFIMYLKKKMVYKMLLVLLAHNSKLYSCSVGFLNIT